MCVHARAVRTYTFTRAHVLEPWSICVCVPARSPKESFHELTLQASFHELQLLREFRLERSFRHSAGAAETGEGGGGKRPATVSVSLSMSLT